MQKKTFCIQKAQSITRTKIKTSPGTMADDWHAFSMELWGVHVASWQPASDRPERLPEPLEYDVLQIGLIQLDMGQRHTLLQCISCYQVSKKHSCIPPYKSSNLLARTIQAGRISSDDLIRLVQSYRYKSSALASLFQAPSCEGSSLSSIASPSELEDLRSLSYCKQ